MGLLDGLASLQVLATTFSGTTLQVGANEISAAEIATDAVTAIKVSGLTLTAAKMAANAASGNVVSLEYSPVYTGSPVAGGLVWQMGSAIATDVSVNVVFGKAFSNIPRVVITPAQSGTHATQSYVGSTEATGFIFVGQSGIAHNWIAVGSGRI